MSPFCSWCGYPAEPIDVVWTGMMRGHGLVWLCTKPGCGHEVERWAETPVELHCLLIGWRIALLEALEARR